MMGMETQRLVFRQWRPEDYATFAAFFSDPEVARFVGGIKSSEEAWRLMATYVGHYELNQFGYLAIDDKNTDALIGTVGLWKSEPWPEVELGYWLLPAAHGQGFAQEAAQAVMKYAFDVLALPTLVSYIDPANTPSIALAQRLGAVMDGEIELLEFGPHQVYRYSPAPADR